MIDLSTEQMILGADSISSPNLFVLLSVRVPVSLVFSKCSVSYWLQAMDIGPNVEYLWWAFLEMFCVSPQDERLSKCVLT